MIVQALNAVVWGVLAAVVGFNVAAHWQAWAIIVTGVLMVNLARATPEAR